MTPPHKESLWGNSLPQVSIPGHRLPMSRFLSMFTAIPSKKTAHTKWGNLKSSERKIAV